MLSYIFRVSNILFYLSKKKEDIMPDKAGMVPPIKVKVGEFIEIQIP